MQKKKKKNKFFKNPLNRIDFVKKKKKKKTRESWFSLHFISLQQE